LGALGMSRRIWCGAGPKKKGEHCREFGEGLGHGVTIPGRARAGWQSVTPYAFAGTGAGSAFT
jgi:hypothetical protein